MQINKYKLSWGFMGASFCNGCDLVALVLICTVRSAAVRVCSVCRVSSTFALGFLVCLLAGAEGVVDGARSGVGAAIEAPTQCWVSHTDHGNERS